jgi:hypothetical protein
MCYGWDVSSKGQRLDRRTTSPGASVRSNPDQAQENQSTSENVAAGEVILVTTQGPMAIIHGPLLVFTTLAYMSQVEKREKFILSVRSLQRKQLMKGIRLPTVYQAGFPRMRTRKAEAAFSMGRKRIHHRLRMGSIGWSVFAGDGIRFPYQKATRDGKIGLEFHGMLTLTAAVQAILGQREKAGAGVGTRTSDSHNSAVANEMHLWTESMPVLPLAMSVCWRFRDVDPSPAHSEGSPSLFDRKLFSLLHTSEWLFDTRTLAEQLRLILSDRIARFDPDKALRLIPAESK